MEYHGEAVSQGSFQMGRENLILQGLSLTEIPVIEVKARLPHRVKPTLPGKFVQEPEQFFPKFRLPERGGGKLRVEGEAAQNRRFPPGIHSQGLVILKLLPVPGAGRADYTPVFRLHLTGRQKTPQVKRVAMGVAQQYRSSSLKTQPQYFWA
jgi:hypothetical protein